MQSRPAFANALGVRTFALALGGGGGRIGGAGSCIVFFKNSSEVAPLLASSRSFSLILLFGGITNVSDNQPPRIGFRAGGDSNTNIPLFDPLGRRFFGGVTVSF